jgi:Domain of unknown function (DUF4158)
MEPTGMGDHAGEDIDDRWTLRASDRVLLGNKTGTTRLGFAVLLKMFQAEGRFPSRSQEVPVAAVEAIARQIGVPAAALLRRFLAGTRRVSPVAQHVLVTVLSLPPRRGEQPYRSVFGWSFCLRPTVAGSTLGDTHFRGHNAFTVVTAR